MRYGIVYGYWNRDWEGEYDETIRRAKANGFDYLEVFAARLLTLSDAELERIQGVLAEHDMQFNYLVGLDADHDVASLDESIRQAGVEQLKQMLRVIHKMGGNKLSGINFAGWMSFTYCARKAECFDASVKSMKEVAQLAQELGITICLEITNRFEQFLLNTAEEAMAYVKAVDSPAVKVLLDSFHMMVEEDNSAEAIKLCGDKLGHFHVGENNRKVPGKGMMRWDIVREGLKAIGYDGDITFEPLVLTGGTVMSGSNIWRDMTRGASPEEMDAEAREGLAFIKDLLA